MTELQLPRTRLMPPLLVALAVAILAASLLRAGTSAATAFGWSNGILLDGGWRVFSGQAPHHDFHSPVGYLYLTLVSLAMRLWGPTTHALAQSAALILPLLAAAAWFIGSRRMPRLLTAATAIFIVVHAASVSYFGSTNSQGISFGGQYSRMAWAVFFLVPLHALILPQRPAPRWREHGEDLVLGIVLGVLFGIKVTYFAAALGCIAVGRVTGPAELHWRGLPALAVGCTLAIGGGLLASGAPLGGYLADLAMAGRSNADGPVAMLIQQILRIDPLQMGLLLAAVLVAWPGLVLAPRFARLPVPLLRALALLLLGFGISAYNGTEYTSPIYGMVLLVIACGATAPPTRESGALAVAVLLGMAAHIALPTVRVGARGRVVPPPEQTLDHGPYRNVEFVAGSPATTDADQLVPYLTRTPSAVLANAYLLWLRDGLAHLRRHARPGAVIATMDVANPFPFALQSPSPRGDVLFWHLDRNVSAATAPAAERALGDAEVVMVPARSLMAGMTAGKMALYRPYLEAHFTPIALDGDRWWQEMWVRSPRR